MFNSFNLKLQDNPHTDAMVIEMNVANVTEVLAVANDEEEGNGSYGEKVDSFTTLPRL